MLITLFLGCSRLPVEASVGVLPKGLMKTGVVLAPVVVVQDGVFPALPEPLPVGQIEAGVDMEHLPAPTVLSVTGDAPFLRNDYIGNVLFGGGFIRTGGSALEVRSRLMEFSLEAEYREQGVRWLGDTVQSVLTQRRVPFRVGGSGDVVGELDHVPVRGLHEEDGRDNVNLPRTLLVPGELVSGAVGEWTLVPYLRSYYSHSGGWFLGQQYGCMGGARVEVLVVLYEEKSPVWWTSATGRFVQGEGMPSRAGLDQYLIWAEDQVEAILLRDLL